MVYWGYLMIWGMGMDYSVLLDMATDLGYELAMSGAETFRVEESITRVLGAYGVASEVFAIPNYLIVSILTKEGTPITRMRRIGQHGNDLDAVEKYNGLSRAYCSRTPDPREGMNWLEQTRGTLSRYPLAMEYLGDFIGAGGFACLFGGSLRDGLCAGLCGMVTGLVCRFFEKQKANPFFRLIAASFVMALAAYATCAAGLAQHPDSVIVGAIMRLVPGLLFTNAMRDIIYGDINSGINRIVQVLLTSIAIALGTAVAWRLASQTWGAPLEGTAIAHPLWADCIFTFLGCMGFSILFNLHGPGAVLCTLGGVASWVVYLLVLRGGSGDILAYFWSALFASLYAESMARIRKYPAISYLVLAIFPMIPGAGAYYTMNYAVRGDMAAFAAQGMHTVAIAGILAVGILLGSTFFRMYAQWKGNRASQKKQ